MALRRLCRVNLHRKDDYPQLQRAVYYGKVPPGTRTPARWRRAGQQIEDAWLARMGPAHFAHVNYRGTFKFGISRYAEMLLGQASSGAKSAA